jgi:hypothetical protein
MEAVTRALAGLLLAGFLAQDPAPQIIPGDPTPKSWPISGPAPIEDGAELGLRARRVERRWDPNLSRFIETLSDQAYLRAVVTVKNKWFDGTLSAGAPGRYGISLATDDAVLYTERAALGPIEPLFTRSIADIKTLEEIKKKGSEFLEEVERLAERRGGTPQEREDYTKRVNAVEGKLRELEGETDLTGTVHVLRDVLFQIRNAQVWGEGPGPKQAANDPPRTRKKLFMDDALTIESLRKTLAKIDEIISAEIKVSTTLILERLIAQARKDDRRREAARAAARAASKLAEAAPNPDPTLGPILDRAASPTTDPDEVRTQLRVLAQPHLVP